MYFKRRDSVGRMFFCDEVYLKLDIYRLLSRDFTQIRTFIPCSLLLCVIMGSHVNQVATYNILSISCQIMLVRPHLEYCIQAWRPYRKKDINKVERIQRRTTKFIPELRYLNYESRLL